ncbi:HAD-IIIC family phosphatase [Mucilaginibacter sp. McL0603]|uniref:HAD-IIIC family phosphatase n=1 Tax=Mucilaginibacter sp. McL0603 TaxID=3415670 RepID=UPI003CEF19D0
MIFVHRLYTPTGMLLVKDFAQLKKSLKKDVSGLKKIRVALLGDSATQLLNLALKATGVDRQQNLDIWEADFNQVERQIFDPTSEFYAFRPQFVIIFRSSHQLLKKYNKLNLEDAGKLADNEIGSINALVFQIESILDARILYYNYPEINDSVFGNYSNKTSVSFLFQIRKLNYELMNFAVQQNGFYIVDISTLQNQFGKNVVFDSPIYVNSEMVLSLDILPHVAAITVDVIDALEGKFKKCVILDLDNTMWGGIIGDDGLEKILIGSLGTGKAFSEFQYWLKKLKNRGIILTVCSKNSESIAKEPFEKHPDMVLRLEDIAVFVANWENKVDNIHHIQSILNISYDSMVFLDDNPFERNMVREQIPQLTIPELPEDPANYLEYLYSLNLFETVSLSEEDKERTKMYQSEAQRSTVQKQYCSEDDFLNSLEMTSLVEPFTKFNIPRVAQLSQRSNQFNLRTIRYTETDLEAIVQSDKFITMSFRLEDKFGDNGLISLIILRKEDHDTLFIETWLMSCRVLKRGMEQFVLNTIVAFGIQNGFKYLTGEYIPTAKNDMVKNHYADLGFTQAETYWCLDMTNYKENKTFIKKIESDGKS